MNRKPIEQRFWEKVQKGPNENDCWIWTAAKRGQNLDYGVLKVSVEEGDVAAHKFSYELHNGPVPEGMLVCHTCDNPPCVNPAHLFTGTHRDNAIDREKKHRSSKHGLQKLDDKSAKEIKYSTLSQCKLSKIYGVSRATIASIQKGKTWRHI